ncbi:ParA family protein [Rhodococcus jostii]|uniref:ParA family protein n=1 Tax=Rhodococcus jostii TaxID=132919 RepID=UPI0036515AEE
MTPPTVDVEITSKTTASATLADADVPPMDLEATESKTLSTVVREFLHNMAQAQGADVEVVYRTAKDTRFLTVGPDGKAEERAPSMPLPIVTPTAPEPVAAEPVSTPPGRPVVVAAEQIAYAAAPQPAAPTRAAPAESVTGLLDVLPQRSAPRADPAASDPARLGVRGRLNAVLGLELAPKTDSLEMRLSDAQTTIARPLPEGAVITYANLKGGVGKTPMSISLAETLAEHRGPATVTCMDLGEVGGSFADRVAVPPAAGQDVVSLAGIDPTTADARPSRLARFLTRQPAGSDIIAGRAGADSPLRYDDAAALGAILGRHRDVWSPTPATPAIPRAGGGRSRPRTRWSSRSRCAATPPWVPSAPSPRSPRSDPTFSPAPSWSSPPGPGTSRWSRPRPSTCSPCCGCRCAGCRSSRCSPPANASRSASCNGRHRTR